jgi:hypothetical protein
MKNNIQHEDDRFLYTPLRALRCQTFIARRSLSLVFSVVVRVCVLHLRYSFVQSAPRCVVVKTLDSYTPVGYIVVMSSGYISVFRVIIKHVVVVSFFSLVYLEIS